MNKVLKMSFQLLLIFLVSTSYGQDKKSKWQETVIHTSVECQQCKDRIEGVLNYTKGIKYAEVNYVTQELTVKYNTKKISLDEIRQIIADTGYDADDIKADEAAVEKLPACCKPGGMKH